MKTRCKLYVTDVKHTCYASGDNVSVPYAEVNLNVVYSPDPSTENNRFWTASPNGRMTLRGPAEELKQFAIGTFWYVDTEHIQGISFGQADELSPEGKERLDSCISDVNEGFDCVLARLSMLEKGYGNLTMKLVHDGALRTPQMPGNVSVELQVGISNKNVWSQYKSLDDLYEMAFTQTMKDPVE